MSVPLAFVIYSIAARDLPSIGRITSLVPMLGQSYESVMEAEVGIGL